MEENLLKVKEILKKYNQEHLLEFYNELNNEEKETLVNQILTIDFDQIIILKLKIKNKLIYLHLNIMKKINLLLKKKMNILKLVAIL